VKEPLISIIIPVYNKEKYIEGCLNSVLNQTYKNLEVIVVDDGSTDNSLQIIQQKAKHENRLKIITQNNLGRSRARNVGINASTGKYLLMVDADDCIAFNCIEKMYQAIERAEADCAVCEMKVVSGGGYERIANHVAQNVVYSVDKTFIYNYIAKNGWPFASSSCNKLFKKEIIENNHIGYRDMTIGEDFAFCIDYALVSHKWITVPYPLYMYYQNFDSTMHTYNKKYFKNLIELMEYMHMFPKKITDLEYYSSAFDSANVKNIFKYIVGIYNSHNINDCLKIIRETIMNPSIVRYIQEANYLSLRKIYRLILLFLRIRCVSGLYLMCKLYQLKNK